MEKKCTVLRMENGKPTACGGTIIQERNWVKVHPPQQSAMQTHEGAIEVSQCDKCGLIYEIS
jgi:hypothetical protein